MNPERLPESTEIPLKIAAGLFSLDDFVVDSRRPATHPAVDREESPGSVFQIGSILIWLEKNQ
jgi:hypothetical protein